MGIVLLTLRFTGLGAGQEPHMQLLRALDTQTLLQVVGNLVGIDEMTMHTSGNILGSFLIETVGVDERVAFYQTLGILEGRSAEGLVIVILGCHLGKVTAYHAVHQHRDATMLACLTHKLRQVIVEGRARIGMALGLWLLVIVTELDDDIVAWPHLL